MFMRNKATRDALGRSAAAGKAAPAHGHPNGATDTTRWRTWASIFCPIVIGVAVVALALVWSARTSHPTEAAVGQHVLSR
jgi:hypothetical protein